jgi:hypothetical protein
MSNIREDGENTNGYYFEAEIGKVSGSWQYDLEYNMADENYDINDLGFQQINNYQNLETSVSYRLFEPNETFRRYSFYYWSQINYRHSDGAYTGNHMGLNFNATTLKNFGFGSNINGSIGDQYDYYEPRVEDRYYVDSPRLNFNVWIGTDEAKKLSVDAYMFYGIRLKNDQKNFEMAIEPNYRVTDKFSLIYNLNIGKTVDENGYVDELDDGTIIFGNRDTREIVNSLSGSYYFSTKSAIALTFRHYWSPVTYDSQFYELNDDGSLSEHSYSENQDINYNLWNLDLSYTWEFAPGSHLIALYRNNAFNEDDLSGLDFYENLSHLFKEPAQHNVSLKLIYYIDYNNAKNWFKKKA